MFTDTSVEKNIDGVESRPSGVSLEHRHGREDPHWCQRKFSLLYNSARERQMLEILVSTPPLRLSMAKSQFGTYFPVIVLHDK